MLPKGIDPNAFAKRISEFMDKIQERTPDRPGNDLVLQPMTDIHLHSNRGLEIEANGSRNDRNGSAQPVLLMARFVAQDRRVYQVLALGEEKSLPREATDVFFTSFKLLD